MIPSIYAEVSGERIRIAPDFARGCLMHHLSGFEDIDAVGDRQRAIQILFDEEKSRARPS